ncbi:MAG: hypothetical protein HQL53_04295 [Magnetococcales bacterium]|nr:hypothetical protein [Magnetococcales bacterium]
MYRPHKETQQERIDRLTQEAEKRVDQEGTAEPYTLERFRKTMFSKLRKVGVREFDDHHVQLVNYIVDVYEVVQVLQLRAPNQETLDKLTLVLDKLQEYTVFHFGEEEIFFEKIEYPHRQTHIAQHKAFVARFLEIRREIAAGRPQFVMDLFFAAFGWLFDHINQHDMKYSRYVQDNPKLLTSLRRSPPKPRPS